MAERFGGKYSPDAAGKAAGARDEAERARAQAIRDENRRQREIENAGKKATVLLVPGAILLFTSLRAGPVGLIVGLAGTAALLLAAWLTREGLKAEAAYNARSMARRPALPRKILGTILTGAGIGLAAWTKDAGIAGSVLYGLAASALHMAAFGLDPLRDKRVEGIDHFQQDRVARVVTEAEGYLGQIEGQIETLGDRKLSLRIASFLAQARKMIRTVEEDPRDLTEARKYLGVFLMGARDATVKFVDLYRRQKDEAARTDYEALLTDLETNFAARTQRMLSGDRTDMDIEIKVLRDRLQREGV